MPLIGKIPPGAAPRRGIVLPNGQSVRATTAPLQEMADGLVQAVLVAPPFAEELQRMRDWLCANPERAIKLSDRQKLMLSVMELVADFQGRAQKLRQEVVDRLDKQAAEATPTVHVGPTEYETPVVHVPEPPITVLDPEPPSPAA